MPSDYIDESSLWKDDEYVSEDDLFGPPKRTAGSVLKDVGVSVAKGLAGAGEAVVGLADIPTGGRVGKALDSVGLNTKVARDFYDEQYSPAQQQANQAVEDAEGFIPTVKAYAQNPSTILHQGVETLPSMALGGVAGGALRVGLTKAAPKIAAKIAPKVLGAAAGATGEGLIAAGSTEEQIRQQAEGGTTTAKQGLAATGAGIGTSIFGFIGGRLAQKFGFADPDTLFANSFVSDEVKKGGIKEVAKRIVGGGISEGMFEELPQSVQETIWQNAALDKPLMEGVPESAAAGLVLGGAMGTGANLLPARQKQDDNAISNPAGAEPSQAQIKLGLEAIDNYTVETPQDPEPAIKVGLAAISDVDTGITAKNVPRLQDQQTANQDTQTGDFPAGFGVPTDGENYGTIRKAGNNVAEEGRNELTAAEGGGNAAIETQAEASAEKTGATRQGNRGIGQENGDPVQGIGGTVTQADGGRAQPERSGGSAGATEGQVSGIQRIDTGPTQSTNEPNVGMERSTKQVVEQPKSKLIRSNSFTVSRYDTAKNENRDDTFSKGETVSAWFSKDDKRPGKIVGISHAKKQVKVKFPGGVRADGIWFDFGQVYKTTPPDASVATPPATRTLSGGVSAGATIEGRITAKRSKEADPEIAPNSTQKPVHDFSNTQVNIKGPAAKKIVDFGKSIPDSELYTGPNDDSYGRETEPHITVRYGLGTDNPAELAELSKVGTITAKIGKVSIFETDKYDVVKAEISSDSMRAANKKVGELVDLPGETYKDYQPHATIAYVKKGEGKKYVGNKALEGTEITFDEIALTDRNGKSHPIKLTADLTRQTVTTPSDLTPSQRRTLSNLTSTGKVKMVSREEAADVLEKYGVKDVRTSSDGEVQGFTTPDTVYIVPENISGSVWKVAVHEVGVHVSRALQSDKSFRGILRSIENRKDEKSVTGEAIREAMKRIPADTNPEYRTEETLAYLVEISPNISIVRQFIALVRNVLYRLGFDAKIFTAEDLAALAEVAVRWEAMSPSKKSAVGVKGSFAGKNAKTAEPFSLAAAQDMEKSGADRREIWRKTGWWKLGKDWKFEIDDSLTSIDPNAGTTLADILSGTQIFRAYPQLKTVRVRFEDMMADSRGSYNPETRIIRINNKLGDDQKRSTLHHETQHIIQKEGGFSTGGSMRETVGVWRSKLKELEDNVKEINKQLPLYSGKPEYQKLLERRQESVAEILKIEGPDGSGAWDLGQRDYKLLTGEVESRLVQQRLNMSPAQRKNVPPWVTLANMLKREGLMEEGQKIEDVLIDRNGGGVEKSGQNDTMMSMKDGTGRKLITKGDGALRHTPVRVVYRPGNREFSIADNGQAVIYVDPIWRRDKEGLQRILFRDVANFLSPLEDNEYIRVARDRADFDHLKSGSHKGSWNDREKEWEGGISVSKEPEYPAKYAYYVTGKEIGQGGDGEPLLGTSSVKPKGKLFIFEKLRDDFDKKKLEKAARLGLSAEQLKALSNARLEIEDGKIVEYSPGTDSRIMYSEQAPLSPESLSETAVEAYDNDLQESAGKFYEKIHDKPDMPILSKILSTPAYYFKQFPATWKMFNAQLDRHTEKFNLENDMLGDFVQVLDKAQKEIPSAYQKFKEHLIDTDKTGKSYRMKHEQKWEVKDDDGLVVGYTLTKREGEQLAREDIGKSGKHIKDYKTERIDVWTVIDPKGHEGDQFLNEPEAVDAMEQAEYFDLINAGWSKEEAGIVRRFRKMTNTVFDHMIADLRKIITETDALGVPEPTIDVPDESRRWGVYEDGKEIAAFATEPDAVAAIAIKKKGMEAAKLKDRAKYEVKEKPDKDIMKTVKLSEMIAMMSDLRGQYFPRQRKPGGVILRAVKGDDKIMEKFDLYIAGRNIIDSETGVVSQRPMSEWLRKKFNQATGFIPFADTLEKRARQLRTQGYDIVVEKDTKTPESVFDVVHLSASVDALLREAAGNAKKKRGMNEAALLEINKILTANVADLFKARGYLSSRLRRSPDYWKGFEEDPLLAGTQYARGIAAGIAKRDSAKKMMAAMTGRDQSWAEWKIENPDGEWEEYDAIVEKNRLDPKQQPTLHKEALGFMEEVLRNDEQIDRVLGTIKGLAVMKFLGFRVSSAAVNLTNMVMAVPATISSISGRSIPSALNAIRKSAAQYAKYRSGKGELSDVDRAIFLEISNNGWDQAQFNQENAAVLMSKLGRGWAKFGEISMYMFGAVEKANRAMTIFSAYKEIRANSTLTHDEAMNKAKHVSDRAHGIYGKENLPTWARGSANPLKLTYTFQTFAHNYMLNMAEMGLKGDKKQFAYMLLSPALMGGAGATLVTPLIALIAKGLGAGDDPEEEFYAWAEDMFGSDSIARHGIPGAFGINLKGSIEMNNPIPTTMSELFGAPQALFNDTKKAYDYARKGEVMKAGEALLPTAIGSAIKAVREGREGLTTGSYSPVFYGDEPLKATDTEQFVRALSFNPSRISGIREKQWHEKQVTAKYNKKRARVIEGFKRYYLFGSGDYQELMKEFHHYNELVRGSGRKDITKLTRQSIRRAVQRARRPSKTERLREE